LLVERIKQSVQQFVEKEEAKNESARFAAEKNHHVKPEDETIATITNLLINNPNPTPGSSPNTPAEKDPGNSEKTVKRQDQDRPGEKLAPNETRTPRPPQESSHDGRLGGGQQAVAGQNGREAKTPTEAKAEIAKVLLGDGSWAIAQPTAASSANPGAISLLPIPGARKYAAGFGDNALSIDTTTVRKVVSQDELTRLDNRETELRLSQHRGSWKNSDLSRWRAAIENYVAEVRPGSVTNLGTAASPFATYFTQIHLRVHPIFSEDFVDYLTSLPANHPLNDPKLVTVIEIVLTSEGTIDHLGVVRHSGQTAFDVAALDAIDRAAPFGKPPAAIISYNGKVYLHWEFHRDDWRCSTANAAPYILAKPDAAPSPLPMPAPAPPGSSQK
jgi:TonB family protein